VFGSAVFSGIRPKRDAYEVKDQDGNTFLHELERIGYRGPEACGDHPIAGYCEVHIEQGPILEENGSQIGVVTGIQGMRWYDIAIDGVAGHAGTTPMHLRRDAMVGAANVIERFRRLSVEYDPSALVTTGSISVSPGSRNVIAARATVTLDVRHPTREMLDDLERAFENEIERIQNEFGLGIHLDRILASDPVEFDPRCVDAVRTSARSEGVSHLDLMSGATHDAANIAPLAPTAMIFVPCADGISHNEMESISPHDAHAGAQILLGTVLQYDEILK
jgi:N-carbamoyl-L-amino-acid hydrolase